MKNVLVLNNTEEPLQMVTLHHAVRMLIRNVAVVHEPDTGTPFGVFQRPKTVRLVNYVYAKWRHGHPIRWSRRVVLRRDSYTCAYCGTIGANTIDHVVPISRGGKKKCFLNTVAACGGTKDSCNSRKANKTLAEANMQLQITPYVPNWAFLGSQNSRCMP